MREILTAIAAAYIVTVVITSSSLTARAREIFRRKTPWLKKTADLPHFIDCRLCVGAWISAATTIALGLPLPAAFLIYGASYFLATQER